MMNLRTGSPARVLYDFHAEGGNELSIKKGEIVKITRKEHDGWSLAANFRGIFGWVPTAYVVGEGRSEGHEREALRDDRDLRQWTGDVDAGMAIAISLSVTM
ncbi:SH3 domain-containing protein [Whalleya microplaca]|nr:SH3 domain-containing protein [Whalleya microplaca]